MKHKSQNQRILALLQKGKTITTIQAISMFECTRLARVINDLRNAGHHIITEMVTKNGKTFAKYSLI